MKRRSSVLQVALLTLLCVGAAGAWQEPAQPPSGAAGHDAGAQASETQQPSAEKRAPSSGEELAEASKRAEEGDKFKHSAAVKWIAKTLHIPIAAEYWVLYSIDFAIIAFAVWWLMKSKLPGVFRTRNEAIRRSIDEAARVSAEARARLGDIESRLARIDAEIADIRNSAEAEAKQEEARIRAAAEEDKQRIIAGAEQEITAASKLAQRELKSYAASLAVELAERRVKVDAETDRALVRNFARDFGKDGE